MYISKKTYFGIVIFNISKKIASSLWLLSQIKSFLLVDDILLFDNAYIRPHIEYCSVIWGNSTNLNIKKMTKLPRRACKLILGSEYRHLDEACNHLKILSFNESVFLNKAKMMYKITTLHHHIKGPSTVPCRTPDTRRSSLI